MVVESGGNSIGENRQAAELQLEACEKRVFDLLDDISGLEQFRREQLIFRKLSGYLKSALTAREAHAAIECFGPQLWPAATGTVYLVHANGDYFERAATWGDASLTHESLAWQDCWATRNMRPHSVRGSGSEIRCLHIAQTPAALPSLCVPLVAQGQMLGLLHLQHLNNIPETSQHDAAADPWSTVAVAVAEELSLAHANMRLRESLLEQSTRDSLTGLFNRRFVDEFLARELARAARKTRQLSMIALDIDHFKRINDSFGHAAGDTVLQKISSILRAHVRDTDIASRIGGEEFLLLLSESPLSLATKRAEDIRSAISQMSLTYKNEDLGRITASFGAVAFPEHGRTAESLIRAADKALYDAKHAGRNQVVSAKSTA